MSKIDEAYEAMLESKRLESDRFYKKVNNQQQLMDLKKMPALKL